MLALFITGTTINIVALIGVIMLAGIVVNNAIVLVDLINQLRAQGMERVTGRGAADRFESEEVRRILAGVLESVRKLASYQAVRDC